MSGGLDREKRARDNHGGNRHRPRRIVALQHKRQRDEVDPQQLANRGHVRQRHGRHDDALAVRARLLHEGELVLGQHPLIDHNLLVALHAVEKEAAQKAQNGRRVIVGRLHALERADRQRAHQRLVIVRAAQPTLDRGQKADDQVAHRVAGRVREVEVPKQAREHARRADERAPRLAALPEAVVCDL